MVRRTIIHKFVHKVWLNLFVLILKVLNFIILDAQINYLLPFY